MYDVIQYNEVKLAGKCRSKKVIILYYLLCNDIQLNML
jgi:hypothetical protein